MAGGPAAQDWQAERYGRNARFVADLGAPLVELLAPRPGERVLDLGCGDGALSLQLMAAGCSVVGVDAAADMVRRARELGVDARLADGHALGFENAFDAVFSNAALHWMSRDPDAVLAGVARALVPGGRLVAELGGHGNVAAIVTALLAVLARRGIDGEAAIPWYFPTTEAYRAKLEAAGLEVSSIALIPRPTALPTGIEGWLETFAAPLTGLLEPTDRPRALAEVAALLRPSLCDQHGGWTADYVRLRLAARRPGGVAVRA